MVIQGMVIPLSVQRTVREFEKAGAKCRYVYRGPGMAQTLWLHGRETSNTDGRACAKNPGSVVDARQNPEFPDNVPY